MPIPNTNLAGPEARADPGSLQQLKGNSRDALAKISGVVKTLDETQIMKCKEEIDTLLVVVSTVDFTSVLDCLTSILGWIILCNPGRVYCRILQAATKRSCGYDRPVIDVHLPTFCRPFYIFLGEWHIPAHVSSRRTIRYPGQRILVLWSCHEPLHRAGRNGNLQREWYVSCTKLTE